MNQYDRKEMIEECGFDLLAATVNEVSREAFFPVESSRIRFETWEAFGSYYFMQ